MLGGAKLALPGGVKFALALFSSVVVTRAVWADRPENSSSMIVLSHDGSGGGSSAQIRCGQTLEGQLDPSDVELNDGTWVDDYGFTLTEETSVIISLRSAAFEEYLFLEDSEGNSIFQGTQRTTVRLPAGSYSVFANNFEVLPDGTYPYQLVLYCSPVEQVECGQTISGSLEPDDYEMPAGTWQDVYYFTLANQTTVTFDITDDAFMPYVFVVNREGVLAEGEPPLTTSLAAGNYVVLANNFALLPDGHYPYSLRMSCGTASCAGDCDADRVVTIDELIRGVSIGLGAASVDSCRAFDRDGNDAVTVSELIQAVNAALGGCGS